MRSFCTRIDWSARSNLSVVFSVLLVSIPSTKVVENPFQVQMPGTIEELQGVVAGLSEVVKGLVNTVQQQSAQLQAHTTPSTSQATSQANSADTTSGCSNQYLMTLRLPTLQLPTFRQDKTAQDDIAEFLRRFQSKHLTFPPKFACRSWNNRSSVSGRV